MKINEGFCLHSRFMAVTWAPKLMRPLAFSSGLFTSYGSLILANVRSSSSSALPVLTLFTHDECSLCDDALVLIQHLKPRFDLKTVDILAPENKEWRKKYRYDIPVFHFEGEYLMKHRANVQLLADKLDQFENSKS